MRILTIVSKIYSLTLVSCATGTWVTTRKEYNEFGEIIYEEKSTRYHR
jgi:hypothetical protein